MTAYSEGFPFWAEIIASLLLVLSGMITLVGTIGLVRFKQFKERIHAPTIGNSLGIICLMLASVVVSLYVDDRVYFQEVIIVVLLFLSSPINSMLLMRSYTLRIQRMGIE